MANNSWRGDAVAKAQSQYYTFGGTWLTTETVTITINGKAVATVTGSATIATLIATVVAAFNNLDTAYYPEFYGEITASISGSTLLVFTSKTPGRPFTVTVTTNSASGTISAAIVTQASVGPNHWDDPTNWSAGTIPAAGEDVYIENSSVPIKYGLDQTAVAALTSLNRSRTHTAQIGLPDVNTEGTAPYREYRTKSLIIKATTANIGYGDSSSGMGTMRWNGLNAQTTINLNSTGRPDIPGVPAFQFIGTHASNVLNMLQGDAGIANNPGEAATLLTVRIGSSDSPADDVRLVFGAGCTIGTVSQAGGILTSYAAIATLWTMLDGTAYHMAGAAAALTIEKGSMLYESTGTIGTLIVGSEGDIDFSRDLRARAITNTVSLYEGAGFYDPWGTVSGTPAFNMVHGDFNQLKRFSVGTNKTLTRS